MPIFLKTAEGAQAQQVTNTKVEGIVKDVIQNIRANGDAAVRQYSKQFDSWSPSSFRMSKDEIQSAIDACSKQTIEDIKQVQRNVRKFAEAQKDSLREFEFEIEPGVFLGQKNNPIERVGA